MPVIAVLCFVFLSPAFAEFKKVNECELARANASLTGQMAEDGSTPADDYLECKEPDRYGAIPAEGEPSTNGGGFVSLHDEYGYDWLQNRKSAGELYYSSAAASSPLTVEAGTDYVGLYGPYGATYLRIGLGAQEVTLESMDVDVNLGSKAAGIAGQKQILGSLHLDGLSVKSNANSYVTLYKTNDQMGMSVTLDTTIDRVSLATLSWGDADGFPGECPGCNTSQAGYVGLKDTNIFGVTASGGPLFLGVETGDIGGIIVTKAVHMGITNLNVGIASLDTTVVVGNKKDFSDTKYVLGTLYLKQLALNVGGYVSFYDLSDKNLAAGVSFDFNVSELTLDTLAWGDPDGIGGKTTAGYVGLRHLAINKLAIAGRATIDTLTADNTNFSIPPGIVFVRLGLTDLNISMDSLDTDVALGKRKDNMNQTLGSIYLGGLVMKMNGTVDIHPPTESTQGIVLDLSVNFSKFTMRTLSWGDADGLGSGSGAGFRGWRNLTITGLTLAGRVSIDVATVNCTEIPPSADSMYYAYDIPRMSPSFVHIGIGTGNSNDNLADPRTLVIGMASLSADVVLDSSKSLNSTNAGVLGSIYIAGMAIRANGRIDIGAH